MSLFIEAKGLSLREVFERGKINAVGLSSRRKALRVDSAACTRLSEVLEATFMVSREREDKIVAKTMSPFFWTQSLRQLRHLNQIVGRPNCEKCQTALFFSPAVSTKTRGISLDRALSFSMYIVCVLCSICQVSPTQIQVNVDDSKEPRFAHAAIPCAFIPFIRRS